MKRKESTTMPVKRRQYDADFKASAVKMIQNGQGVSAVSRALGVGENLLHRWHHLSKQGSASSADSGELESLFSRFKAELMDKGAFDSFEDAYTEIFEYIEIYYNTQRRHSGIGYEIPQAFEKAWEEAQELSKS